MRGRESGMPDIELWEKFFDPVEVVLALSDPGQRNRCVEFGSGYGTFTIASAAMDDVKAIVSLDIDATMIATTRRRLAGEHEHKVTLELRDFVTHGSGLPDDWADWAMVFNLLHIESPVDLLAEAHRVLRPGGTLALIHWRDDIVTPRGPSLSIRPSRQQCQRWAEEAGFELIQTPSFDRNPWHWGLKLRALKRRELPTPSVGLDHQ